MLCSLHTMSLGARHVVRMQCKCNAVEYTTIQCNAMQCNAMAQPNARENVMSWSVPAYGVLGRSPCHPAPSSEHTVLFLRSFVYKTAAKPNPKKKRSVIYPSLHGVLERYNTMQCNAMQCNAMAQPNARENAMSCSVPCIRCPRALAMPSSPIF